MAPAALPGLRPAAAPPGGRGLWRPQGDVARVEAAVEQGGPGESRSHRPQTAAHLVDRVIPPVPVRQWVISVPKRLRCFLADRQSAVAALTRIFVSSVERLLCNAAGSTRDGDRPSAADHEEQQPGLAGLDATVASRCRTLGSEDRCSIQLSYGRVGGILSEFAASQLAGGFAARE